MDTYLGFCFISKLHESGGRDAGRDIPSEANRGSDVRYVVDWRMLRVSGALFAFLHVSSSSVTLVKKCQS